METIYISYIIIGILTISNIFFIWRGTQLVRQVEDAVNEIDNVTNETFAVLNKMQEEMKAIDIRGSFESDDEIGWFFKGIKEIQDLINEYNINHK